ncbi:MAG: CRISPR-associated protein Cas5 [Nocardioidaceae bacterium]
MSESTTPPPPPSDPAGSGQPAGTGPGSSAPPPAQPTPSSGQPTPRGSGGMSGDQMKATMQNAHKYDLGIIGAGVLAFIFSLLPYYTVSVDGGPLLNVSESGTAWHGFFGWFATLLALAAAVVLVLHLLGVTLPVPTRMTVLGMFAAALLCTIVAFFVFPGAPDCQGFKACEDAVNLGRGIGYWLSLLAIIGGLALSVMRKDARD